MCVVCSFRELEGTSDEGDVGVGGAVLGSKVRRVRSVVRLATL